MLKRGGVLAVVVACGLASAGCEDASMFAEPDPRGGIALVGGEYVAYFPLCGTEATGYRMLEPGTDRPMSVDELASSDAESTEAAEFEAEVYWEVEGPSSDMTKDGWVVLGADSQFTTVTTSLPEGFDWPDALMVQVFPESHPGKGSAYSALTYDLAGLPEYDAGADLARIEYRSGEDLATPAELRKASGLCS